jgi:hypothetical protein
MFGVEEYSYGVPQDHLEAHPGRPQFLQNRMIPIFQSVQVFDFQQISSRGRKKSFTNIDHYKGLPKRVIC